jgi:hypothetical protein
MVNMKEKIKQTTKVAAFFRKALLLPKIANTGIDYNYLCSTRWVTYSPLQHAVVLDTSCNRPFDKDKVFNSTPIGFTFNFNGTNYERLTICENGYIKMGNTIRLPTAHPLSNYFGDDNVISAFGTQLRPNSESSLLYKVTGSMGDRVLIIEWRNYRFYGTGNFNFQVKLHEKRHLIAFTYGSCRSPIPLRVQIGLRGRGSFDVTNRLVNKKTKISLKPSRGNNYRRHCEMSYDSSSVFGPISGLTYVWTPFLTV